jgi:hypothetical protein
MSKEKNGKWENSHNYAKSWCALKIAKNSVKNLSKSELN